MYKTIWTTKMGWFLADYPVNQVKLKYQIKLESKYLSRIFGLIQMFFYPKNSKSENNKP